MTFNRGRTYSYQLTELRHAPLYATVAVMPEGMSRSAVFLIV